MESVRSSSALHPAGSEPREAGANRRSFLKAGAVALTAASYNRVRGANDRIGVGMMGYGLIGKRHTIDFKEQPDVSIVAVAETHQGRRDECASFVGGPVKTFADFRKMLDDKDVNAVCVSTPDHWHALATMMACAAGKDVYVEKPLTLFVREGRWMIDVANRYNRVVQVGTQQRSGPHYQRARKLIEEERIGTVHAVQMASYRNIYPGYGSPPDSDPPPEIDWNMLLGPAPYVKYNPKRAIYHFRWFWDYSGGQMTNLGQHSMDIIYWYLKLKGPKAVSAVGGKYVLQDLSDTPDTQDVLFEFPGLTVSYSCRECSHGKSFGGLNFYGRKGSLSIGRSGFEITPDAKIPPVNTVPQFTGPHPVGGPVHVAVSGEPEYWTEAMKDDSGDSEQQFKLHVRNFLDCVKSRQKTISNLEEEHPVVTACHLGNISLRVGRKIFWDAEKEQIIGDSQAEAMLVRPYRKPWDAELRALGISA